MEFALSLLIIAVTGLVVYTIIKTNPARPMPLPARAAKPYQPALPAEAPARHWSDGGHFLVEVVNESRYQATLKALAGAHGDGQAQAPWLATLVPDDVNPYESFAVAVFLDGRMTGYLSPKASVAFRANLKRFDIDGRSTTCDARVIGGGIWQGQGQAQHRRLAYAVALDLEPQEGQ